MKWWIHDRSVGWFHLFTGLTGPTYRDEILQILPYHSLLSTSSVHGTLDANPCSYKLQPITTGVMNFGLFVVKYHYDLQIRLPNSANLLEEFATNKICLQIPPKNPSKMTKSWGSQELFQPFLFGRPTSLLMAPLPPRPPAPVPRRSAAPARLGASKRCKRLRKRCPFRVDGFFGGSKPWVSSITNFFSVGLRVSPFFKEGFFSSSNPGTAIFDNGGNDFQGEIRRSWIPFSVRREVALGRHRDGFPIKACSFLWFVF